MEILIIHAESDRVRKKNIEEQFASQSINHPYTIVPAIMNPGQPSVGIMQSFKKCIQIAKDNSWPEVCIFEDDVRFLCRDSLKLFIHKYRAFSELEIDWAGFNGCLFLGGLYEGEVDDGITSEELFWKKTNGKVSGFQSVVIPFILYDRLLQAEEPYNFDHWCSVEAKIPIYVAYPFLIMQQDGYSFNVRAETNYTEGLRNKYKFIDDV